MARPTGRPRALFSRHHRGPPIAAVYQHIETGKCQHHDVADRMRPRGRLCADQTIAEEIDQPGDRGEESHDDADGHEPSGEIRLHHLATAPIGQVRQQGSDEAGNWKWHQHRMNGCPAIRAVEDNCSGSMRDFRLAVARDQQPHGPMSSLRYGTFWACACLDSRCTDAPRVDALQGNASSDGRGFNLSPRGYFHPDAEPDTFSQAELHAETSFACCILAPGADEPGDEDGCHPDRTDPRQSPLAKCANSRRPGRHRRALCRQGGRFADRLCDRAQAVITAPARLSSLPIAPSDGGGCAHYYCRIVRRHRDDRIHHFGTRVGLDSKGAGSTPVPEGQARRAAATT